MTVGEEAIATTPEHEFYTSNGWVEAEDLSVGDTLVRLGGKTATVTDLEFYQDSTRVYNFEVDEAHTYYVSGIIQTVTLLLLRKTVTVYMSLILIRLYPQPVKPVQEEQVKF